MRCQFHEQAHQPGTGLLDRSIIADRRDRNAVGNSGSGACEPLFDFLRRFSVARVQPRRDGFELRCDLDDMHRFIDSAKPPDGGA